MLGYEQAFPSAKPVVCVGGGEVVCINVVKSWVSLKFVVALVTSVYQRLQIPLVMPCV